MNYSRLLIIFLLTIGITRASSAQINLGAFEKDLSAGKIDGALQIGDAEAKALLPAIRGFVFQDGSHSNSSLETARKIPNLPRWVGQDIQRIITLGRYDFTVFRSFELLGRLRTPEAVREIGKFIDSKSVLESPSEDLAGIRIDMCAALSLSLVGFKNAPTPNLYWSSGLGKSDLEAWKTWWKTNQQHIDELVIDANSNPPPGPNQSASDGTQPATPASHPNSKATASQEPGKPATNDRTPLLLIIPAAAACALVYFLRRTNGSR